jgi:hypothetical protein
MSSESYSELKRELLLGPAALPCREARWAARSNEEAGRETRSLSPRSSLGSDGVSAAAVSTASPPSFSSSDWPPCAAAFFTDGGDDLMLAGLLPFLLAPSLLARLLSLTLVLPALRSLGAMLSACVVAGEDFWEDEDDVSVGERSLASGGRWVELSVHSSYNDCSYCAALATLFAHTRLARPSGVVSHWTMVSNVSYSSCLRKLVTRSPCRLTQ